MRRPIVKEAIVDYMRSHLLENQGHLAEIEGFAHAHNIPIIQHEVVAYFRLLMQSFGGWDGDWFFSLVDG